MRVEMRREFESQPNKGLSAGQDEVNIPRQSVTSTTSIVKLSCIKEETYCCLYVPSSVSTQEKVTCATAMVFPIGDGLIYGKKLLKGHMKVSVINVMDFHKSLELLEPNDEFPTLLNAVKGFIQWPVSAIARFKGLTKPSISRAPTKSVLFELQKVPAIEQGKIKDTAQEPTQEPMNKKNALEETTKHKMALAMIAEQTKAKERLELGILTCFEMSLYQLKGCSQQIKVGFLHPELITSDVYGANKGVTLDYLARALEGHDFYVAPYLQDRHYVLFIICPKHGKGFILDPLKESVFNTEDNYMLAGLVDSLKWELPVVNRQSSTWECGYYVMKWMHNFVLKYQNDNFPNTIKIPWGEERRLENKELDVVIGAWFTLWRG